MAVQYTYTEYTDTVLIFVYYQRNGRECDRVYLETFLNRCVPVLLTFAAVGRPVNLPLKY